ncbi:sigma factor-like helix-turn-helix DNA-binding protein [Streptomyces exfoliatus]|uniref:sigma factor-like helix-turn-helix DNA-binding protein n=1 Tax=Streptomyces exfoliatus TaxID=1905 RepID=UPI00099C5EEF|nr:sigma factor-like helix-turn-helix DNA-binding protein [Streptomyces exfoliatus]
MNDEGVLPGAPENDEGVLPGAPETPFEKDRPRLRAVAHRLLGTSTEAEEAVEDARTTWRRPEDPAAAVARACLARLRARETHRGGRWDPWDPWAAGEPAPRDDRIGPEQPPQAVLARLTPPQRLAFVLHEEFAVPYEEIARVLDHTPAATRRLAARAAHRLREAEDMPEQDLPRQREVVGAFLTAARNGDAAALTALLDPDVVLRADAAAVRAGATGAHGPAAVAEALAGRAGTAGKALVDGAAGLAWPAEGEPEMVLAFTVLDGRITSMDALSDAEHLRRMDLRLTPPGHSPPARPHERAARDPGEARGR